ncbi:MAG TPA: hypothetical protein GX528_03775 [Firmicutes bacterium]|nr:hypothetical protein [Bacillota bacterium]
MQIRLEKGSLFEKVLKRCLIYLKYCSEEVQKADRDLRPGKHGRTG